MEARETRKGMRREETGNRKGTCSLPRAKDAYKLVEGECLYTAIKQEKTEE